MAPKKPLDGVPTPPIEKKKDDIVEVPRETLEKLFAKVEKIEKDNEILKEAAGESAIKRITDLRAQGKLLKTVNLSSLNGTLVTGWSRVKDDVYFDEQGRLHEEQVIRVYFVDDKEAKEMDYRAFSRLKIPVRGEVISESRDKDGNTNLKVLMDDGREVEVDVKFCN